jgi:hypothetical protein
VKRPAIRLTVAFVAGVAFATLLLVAAHVARGWSFRADDEVEAITVALTRPIKEEVQAGTKSLYIRNEYDFLLVPKLQQLNLNVHFHRWKDRPPDVGCKDSVTGMIAIGACERPDYISVNVAARPLWRTLLVTVGYSNGGCDLVLVKLLARWRVISDQCLVT